MGLQRDLQGLSQEGNGDDDLITGVCYGGHGEEKDENVSLVKLLFFFGRG